MAYTIHAAHERIILFPIIAGPPVSKNGPYFKRCVKFCCKKLQAMIKQSENRKKYTRSNRVCPFRLAIMLAGSLHCVYVRVTRRLFRCITKDCPYDRHAVRGLFDLATTFMHVNWIDFGQRTQLWWEYRDYAQKSSTGAHYQFDD